MFDIAQAMEDAAGRRAIFCAWLRLRPSWFGFRAGGQVAGGYLFPNTYQFTRTQSLEEMARRWCTSSGR